MVLLWYYSLWHYRIIIISLWYYYYLLLFHWGGSQPATCVDIAKHALLFRIVQRFVKVAQIALLARIRLIL